MWTLIEKTPQTGHLDDLVEVFHLDVRIGDTQIFFDRGVKKARLLRKIGDLLAPPFRSHLLQVKAIDQNLTPDRFQQPQNQACQGRLAGTVVARNDQNAAWLQSQRHGLEKRRRAARKSERQVPQLHSAFVVGQCRAAIGFERHLSKLFEQF